MLITSPEFTSNLTGKIYYTKSLDPLDCTKSCIWDLLHHIDVGSFYFAMLDEFHQHAKVHRVYIICRK
jgi:hypothetical protein